MRFKLFLSFSIAISVSLFANDGNKTKIFMDRYLPKSKTEQFHITPEMLRKNTTDFNLSGISKKRETNKTKFEKNFGKIYFLKNKEGEKQAEQISNFEKSKSFQKKVLEQENYILYDKSIDWSKYAGKYKQYERDIVNQLKITNSPYISTNKYLAPNEKLFIIISSSLKKETIRNYFKMLERVNTDVAFVMRGIIGSPKKIMPTIRYINDLLIKNPNGNPKDKKNRYMFNIEINPKITRRYNVKYVPAVLFIQNYNPITETNSGVIGKPNTNEKYWVAYGEVGIDYALRQINKKAHSKGIERLLKNLSKSYFK